MDENILLTLLQESPYAVLVGVTIYQLTRVTTILKVILQNQQMLIKRMLTDDQHKDTRS